MAKDWSWAELSRFQLTGEYPSWYKPEVKPESKPPKVKPESKAQEATT